MFLKHTEGAEQRGNLFKRSCLRRMGLERQAHEIDELAHLGSYTSREYSGYRPLLRDRGKRSYETVHYAPVRQS